MINKILPLLFLVCTLETICQIQFKLPTGDTDPRYIKNNQILIDTISMHLEIISRVYDKIHVMNIHRSYKASFFDIDTIILINDVSSDVAQIKFLMCSNKNFVVNDYPYIANSPTYELSFRTLGDWFLEKNQNELEKLVAIFNSYIPNKELCNEKRNLWGSPNLVSDPRMDSDGYYSDGYKLELPSIDGSNSLDHRNNSIQLRIDKCLDSKVEKGVTKVTYYVNEKGNVDKVKFDDFEQPRIDVKRKIIDCMLNIKFEPAVYKGKFVKSECNTLISINTSDKYKIYEDLYKSYKSDKKKVDIPKKLVNLLSGQKISQSEEVFIFKNQVYKDLAQEDSIKRTKLDNDFLIVVYEHAKQSQQKHVEVDEMPSLFNKNFFNELKEKLIELFPNESFDESFEYIVEKDGSISTTRIAKQTNGKVAGEIWRHLYKDLFYFPGKHKGKIVRVKILENVTNK